MTDENKKLTKDQVIAIVKADMRAAEAIKLENDSRVTAWNKEYNGDPYGNEEKGKSAIVSRDIKRQDEWQHASVKDPFVADLDIIKATPVTFEDVTAAQQNELVLNYQFCRQFPRYIFMTDVVKLIYREGTVVAKTSWEYEDKVEKVLVPQYGLDMNGQPVVIGEVETEQRTVIKNKPNATICRLKDVFIDPTCFGDLAKAQFVIHRYESDLSTLRKAGKYKNLDRIGTAAGSPETAAGYEVQDTSYFKFSDKARKKLLVHEYWGNIDIDGDGIAEPIVCTWVEDTIIQLRSNPFPDKEIPFVLVKNNPIPFDIYGEASVELIGDNQKLATAIKRGIVDNLANSNNAQKGIPMGMLSEIDEKRFLAGKHFKFNGTAGALYEGGYNQLPSSVFQVLEMVNNETESMLGVKSFTNGISGNGMGSTAAAARGALDAVSVRRMDIVRNIAENFVKPILRKWAAYNTEFLRPEEVIRITNGEFVPVKRDDLKGNIDIHLEVSTAEDTAAKSQRLAFILQTVAPTMQDPILTNKLVAQMMRLDRLPEVAKMLEEYQPEPDPIAEEMRRLEVENLRAEVAERRSRANENATDIRLKNAKAAKDEATARNIDSDTDVKDLDYIRRAEGEDFAERMAEKDHDRETGVLKELAKPSKNNVD